MVNAETIEFTREELPTKHPNDTLPLNQGPESIHNEKIRQGTAQHWALATPTTNVTRINWGKEGHGRAGREEPKEMISGIYIYI